jgi:Spy/CpxP family protein refolding chaperone
VAPGLHTSLPQVQRPFKLAVDDAFHGIGVVPAQDGSKGTTMSENLNTTNPRRRSWLRWAALGGVAAASVVTMAAWAHNSGAGGMGPGGGMMAMHGGGGGGWFMGRGIDRMLDSVNASDDQRSQIKQIAEAARNDMLGQRDAHRALRDRAMAVFSAPTVDAREAEAVRQAMLAQHDAASKRMTQAMLDVSRVLTPAQRTQLAERMKQRGDAMRQRWGDHQQSRPQS